MKTKLKILAVALLAGGTMLAQPRVAIGIGVGGYGPGYYPPPAYQQYMPPCPGPDYVWIDGYWVPRGGSNVWINGYWRSPYVSGYRVAPRYIGPSYYNSGHYNTGHYNTGNYNSYRGNDRGHGNQGRSQNRGGERQSNRGHSSSNGFRR